MKNWLREKLRAWLFPERHRIAILEKAFRVLHKNDTVFVDWGRKNTVILVAYRFGGREEIRRFEIEANGYRELHDFLHHLKEWSNYSPRQVFYDGFPGFSRAMRRDMGE